MKKQGSSSIRGFTVPELMTVVAISLLLVIAGMASVVRARINANSQYAQETLKTIAMAATEYARHHNGEYPLSLQDLTNGNPPYLPDAYTANPNYGFNFSCTWGLTNFTCSAIPINRRIYTQKYQITSDLLLTSVLSVPIIKDDPIVIGGGGDDGGGDDGGGGGGGVGGKGGDEEMIF
ncbi:MAG: type II secretion system protein [Candidatus Omnitrophota bacterium]